MRGLPMDFPNDKNVLTINDEYLFGPSLLINPVYNYHQRTRKVYLPNGQGWYDLYNGKFLMVDKALKPMLPMIACLFL